MTILKEKCHKCTSFKYKFTTVVGLLLKHSEIDVNREDNDGISPLMEASTRGYAKVVEPLLFHRNIKVNKATWYEGNTALIFATKMNHTEVTNLFLRCPATDVLYQNNEFKTAKDFATITDNFGKRGVLMSNGHTCCSRQMRKGLQIAARDNDAKRTASFLRCHELDLNEGYESGLTPLYIASRVGHFEVAEQLLKNTNIDVNKISNGENPLITAAEKGYTDIVGLLLQFPTIDTNINKRGSEGSALFLASANNHSMIVEQLLLQPQIEVNGKYGARRRTSLIVASFEGHLNVVKLLLRCPKTNITLQNVFGETALDVSGNETSEAINKRDELLKGNHTCCLNATEVLLNLAKVGDYKGIRGLAKCPNADINEQDLKGRTALYLASWMGHLKAVKELVVLPNIDVNRGQILTGETAFSIASTKSHFDVIRILSQHINVDVNKGWLHDGWTNLDVKQKCSSEIGNLTHSSRFNGSMITDKGRTEYSLICIVVVHRLARLQETVLFTSG